MNAAQIDFRPFLTVDAGWDNGLNGVSIDPNGNPVNVSGVSVDASLGLSGLHSWKHTTLGLDYRGGARHNTRNSFYDGFNQSLLFGVTHMLTRHVALSLHQSTGITSQGFAPPTLQQTVPFDPSTAYTPTNTFFDNRTVYFSSQADLQVQRSTRMSFDIGGSFFLTRFRSTALYGDTGVGAHGDLQYRVSRDGTLGATYSYSHYTFRGIFSSTDVHSAGLTYALRMSRTVEMSMIVGVARFETKFEQDVPIDPAVAAIIGAGTAKRVSYNLGYTPSFTARISKTIPRGVLFLSGARTIMPGNGLFLTSKSTAITGGYSYTGLKRWGISATASEIYSNSISNVVGQYSSFIVGGSISREIMRSVHGVFGFNASKYGSGDFRNYNKWTYSVHAGLGFTPGDIPIRLW